MGEKSTGASRSEFTQALIRVRDGEREAFDELFPLIYRELRGMAHKQLAGGRPDELLDTTGLVHEAYLRLVDQTLSQVNDRGHFFRFAATAMRHIVIDAARRHQARKRGGGQGAVPLGEQVAGLERRVDELIAVDTALSQLAELDKRLERVVELRFFAGLSVEETATILDVSPRTIKREWRKARAFLYRALGKA